MRAGRSCKGYFPREKMLAFLMVLIILAGSLSAPGAVRADEAYSWVFTTITAPQGEALKDTHVYEEPNEESRQIAYMTPGALCYLIKDEGDWAFIESGTVRGFILKDSVHFQSESKTDARKSAEDYPTRDGYIHFSMKTSVLKKEEDERMAFALLVEQLHKEDENPQLSSPSAESAWTDIEAEGTYALPMVLPLDTKCFSYTKTTVMPTKAKKVYGLCKAGAVIRVAMDENSQVVGSVPNGGLIYLLWEGDDYYFVESGQSRGFIGKQNITTGEEVDTMVKDLGESSLPQAETILYPEENPACYYVLVSVYQHGENP